MVATVTGELEMATASVFIGRLEAALAGGPVAVIADLSGVSFLASAGLNGLHQLGNHAHAAGVAFCVVSDRRAVLRPLHLTALDQRITIHATIHEARAWVAGQR